MKLSGHVKNNIIILDEQVELPDGIQVEIIVPDPVESTSSGLCGIWQDARPVEQIVEDIISSRSAGRQVAL